MQPGASPSHYNDIKWKQFCVTSLLCKGFTGHKGQNFPHKASDAGLNDFLDLRLKKTVD